MTDSEEQVQLVLEINSDHLRHAASKSTPFEAGTLEDLCGLYGTNSNVDILLYGELNIEDLPVLEEIMVWLKEMGYNNGPPTPVNIKITSNHFKKSVKCVTPIPLSHPWDLAMLFGRHAD